MDVDWIRRWSEDEGRHWVTEAERYDLMTRPFGDAMLAAAALGPGECVLDVGCGNGATTIEAARRVAPDGSVVGLDASPPMLELARQRVDAAGCGDRVELVRADAQRHRFAPPAFDVIVSRNGLMFFDDPDEAFANLAGALDREGRLVFVAWQNLERSEWILVPGMAAMPHVGIPEGLAPDAPGPFALGDPDRLLGILERAGFADVSLEEVVFPICVGVNVEDALGFLRSIPLVIDLFDAASPEDRRAAEDAVREALVPHLGPDGVVMEDNAAWLVVARR